jgi:hypothetical protein
MYWVININLTVSLDGNVKQGIENSRSLVRNVRLFVSINLNPVVAEGSNFF